MKNPAEGRIFWSCFLVGEFELVADLLHFFVGEFEGAFACPVGIDGEKMDVGVGNINTDDFDHNALTEGVLVMFGELFDGMHNGVVVLLGEVIEFIYFVFGDDEGVTGGFGGNI